MEPGNYLKDVVQTNGCRVWTNPAKISTSKHGVELFIKNLPNDLFEADILPHFERYGPVYQFRLLIDYEDNNRGFAYLIYFHQKSALECLDQMGYFIIAPGVMIDVEQSQERSHLQALNVPRHLSDSEIELGFFKLYKEVKNVFVMRDNTKDCQVILEFENHSKALNAKRWSGIGSVVLWNRSIKILWAPSEKLEQFVKPSHEVNHVLAHNVPETIDPDDFGSLMCLLVGKKDIISIRPMKQDWLLQFANEQAAFTIFKNFNGMSLENKIIETEWVSSERLKQISSFVDFDFELRNLCLANYWDPPIFVYGRIIQFTKCQLCSVIIKNNRDNRYTTFFIDVCYDGLIEMHSRVCEALLLLLVEMKEFPKWNSVIKCSTHFAVVVGTISDMAAPRMTPTDNAIQDSICIYRNDIYSLSKLCFQLIASQSLNEIHEEYKMILKGKDVNHQFISGIISEGFVLGCIDPIYRRGKPLKYKADSRHMILAMCEVETLSNNFVRSFPVMHVIKAEDGYPTYLNVVMVELIPLNAVQTEDVHFTRRSYIEFNMVDVAGPLENFQSGLIWQNIHDKEDFEYKARNAPQTNHIAVSLAQKYKQDIFQLQRY